MTPTSPTVARWELTLRLNEWRKRLGIDVETAAKSLRISRNHWWQLMSDRRALTDDHFEAVIKLFGIGDEEQQELHALRAVARERGWWYEYSALFNDENLRLIGLEHGAETIQSYEGLVIPGLLQTESYTRAIMESETARIRTVDVERYVEVRLKRQQRLFGEHPLQVNTVISEAALMQHVGGPDVLHQQLEHLVALTRNDQAAVDIRVVPFTAPRRTITNGSPFHILGFSGAVLPMLVWHESVATQGIIDDAEKVREMRILYSQQSDAALGGEESIALIEEAADRLA
ncbi:putative DNA-binding protein [Nocardia nova SH22a]|uniref:Putative DNA-binding protein n=1 Tax=Nocardia nova SH22a TaxID=1415166 RepID=W5TSK7_9NOCA|nr:helix-turn-helix transcriptional regulator [Nocardia nova]AHH22174.1 putative DNA-binding protein [Nocardia nova SH22a]